MKSGNYFALHGPLNHVNNGGQGWGLNGEVLFAVC